MAIPLTVAWELVRLYLHNRQPPYSKPWKPVSGDGKSHSTNFCDRSIIMQTAVTESLLPKVVMTFKMLSQCYFLATGLCKKIISLCDPTTFLTTAVKWTVRGSGAGSSVGDGLICIKKIEYHEIVEGKTFNRLGSSVSFS